MSAMAIPSGWSANRLGSVCTVDWGNTSITKASYSATGFPAFSATGMDGFLQSYEHDGAAVIVSAIGARCGKCFLANGKWTAIKNTIVIRAKLPKRVDETFLYFLLNDARKWPKSGSGQPFIGIGNAQEITVALPPLSEQRAIAHVLETVQSAKAAREGELTLERERKALLLERLFTFGTVARMTLSSTAYGRVPADWQIRNLEQCAFIQTGVAKGRKLNGSRAIAVPYLRVANVQHGYLDLAEMKTLEIRESELKRYLLQPGDIVLTEGGDFDKLGRGFVWRGEVAPCIHQNHIFAVRPDRQLLSPEFLAYVVQSPFGRAYFLSVAHKTTNLACINKSKLGQLPVPLPLPSEQQSIVQVLSACDFKIAALERESKLATELFNALLEELMTGRLSVAPLIAAEVHA